jgi:hypothetical protein
MKIFIPDVTKPEEAELRKLAPDFDLQEGQLEVGQQGELLTAIAVVTLTQATIFIFSAWLLATRDTEKIRKRVYLELPDGTKTTFELEIDRRSSKAPEAQVLEQINSMLASKNLPQLLDQGAG